MVDPKPTATLPYVESDINLAPHEDVVDVTKPGQPLSRTKGLRVAEAVGGANLLSNSWLNRGTNFTREERQKLKLEGLLPPACESLELQAERVMEQMNAENLLPLNKYNILKEILSTNQTLFYKVLVDHVAELAPIVYTPTVGEGCRRFDLIYREPMGFYLSAFHHKGRFAKILRHWPSKAVQIIVVTDGSRILGLGDLGTNGMGIPIGKVSLFVAAGGFHPEHSLPLTLDVGTNNEELLNDKFYMGERQRRLDGGAYWSAVEELCDAVKETWPHALLQFEDFETSKAFEILEKYRHRQLCFNDDIQGTGAVVTAGIINGLKAQDTNASDVRVVFYGAGSSAVGVAEAIAAYLEARAGVPRERARKAIFMCDSKGLVYFSRGDELPKHKRTFALEDEDLKKLGVDVENLDDEERESLRDLRSVVGVVKPHALVGLSAAGPSWGKEVVEELCRHTKRPLIFPLSNPTDKSEITAQDAYTWSRWNALFASGSPFDPVELSGGKKFYPGQANNVFTFPGVGFGAVMAKAKEVSDGMFVAAAQALADSVSTEQLQAGNLYPKMERLREVSKLVAAAVAQAAWEEGSSGLAAVPEMGWEKYIEEKMWCPGGSEGVGEEGGELGKAEE